MTQTTESRASATVDQTKWVPLSVVLDLVLIVLFAVVGRVSHGESLGFGGVVQTAWPFLTGALLAWLVFTVWRRPLSLVRSGLPVWVLTVALGMVLRVLSGQGTAVRFIVVASIVLCVFLLGWRVVVGTVARRQARRSAVPRASAR